MLDMNTIGLFNYLTELDEEQKQRKQEIDRVIDRIQKERFNPASITSTVSFELTKEEFESLRSQIATPKKEVVQGICLMPLRKLE